MSRRPTDEQLSTAVLWLESNEGEDGEAEACKATAAWIKHLLSESVVQRVARRAGVPRGKAREAIRRIGLRAVQS